MENYFWQTQEMKIYTKGGDTGETSLFGGRRVLKDDLRIQAYGTVDEVNAGVGVTLAQEGIPVSMAAALVRVQNELFQLGAELATPAEKKVNIELVHELEIERLEKEIDAMEVDLPPLRSFILPGGSPAAAQLQLVRTMMRRAERELITLHRSEPLRPVVLKYVNRLSDYFFVASRWMNWSQKVADVPWVAPRNGRNEGSV